jgi:hypothetical protein
MSLFQKAEPEAPRLKMYIYGETGTGKTVTALNFPSPAVIDAEDGTLHYGKEFDFHKIRANDPAVIHQALDELLQDPGDFKTLVIDPMSVVYDQIIRIKEDRMKARTGNMNYELQPLDYKSVKTEVKILMNKLLALDMNVIVTARSKPLYAEGEFMKKIGQQPDGHKNMPYMFDVVLELYIAEDGETRMAKVTKDRTNTLPHEFIFSYDSFVEYMGLDVLERDADAAKQKESINTTNKRTKQIEYNNEQIFTAGITADTLSELEKLLEDVDPKQLKEILMEQFEVDNLLDLTKKNSESFLDAVKNELT